MNAGKQLQALKNYVTKQCSKCGVTYRGYAKSALCQKCYNTEWKKQKRQKTKLESVMSVQKIVGSI